MTVSSTPLPGLLVIVPKIFIDERGLFFESFNIQKYQEAGIEGNFLQDNISVSKRGVLRGLHFQIAPYSQSKLIQVIEGEVWDVAVDMRPDSPYYGSYYSILLSADIRNQLYIPAGFAHGFLTLSERAVFHYKCDQYYHPAAESGIHYADPDLNIKWPEIGSPFIVSDKDKVLPPFSSYNKWSAK